LIYQDKKGVLAMKNSTKLRKEQILKSGLKLFSEQGFQATSMGQIAESVKIARTTLYEYFNSKEDILFSLLDDVVSDQPNSPKEGSTKEKLTFLAEANLSRLQNNYVLYKILFTELPALSLPAVDRIRKWQKQSLERALEVIESGIRSNCFSKSLEYNEIGFVFQALLAQKMSNMLMTHEIIDVKLEAEKLVNIMWNGVSSGGERHD